MKPPLKSFRKKQKFGRNNSILTVCVSDVELLNLYVCVGTLVMVLATVFV